MKFNAERKSKQPARELLTPHQEAEQSDTALLQKELQESWPRLFSRYQELRADIDLYRSVQDEEIDPLEREQYMQNITMMISLLEYICILYPNRRDQLNIDERIWIPSVDIKQWADEKGLVSDPLDYIAPLTVLFPERRTQIHAEYKAQLQKQKTLNVLLTCSGEDVIIPFLSLATEFIKVFPEERHLLPLHQFSDQQLLAGLDKEIKVVGSIDEDVEFAISALASFCIVYPEKKQLVPVRRVFLAAMEKWNENKLEGVIDIALLYNMAVIQATEVQVDETGVHLQFDAPQVDSQPLPLRSIV